MNNVLIDLGFIKIYWYSIMIIIGIILGYIFAIREIKKNKIDEEEFKDILYWVLLFSFLGARIYYCLFNLDYYLSDPILIFKIWEGGLAIHGGIIAGVITLIILCKKRKLPYIKIMDIIAPSLLIGQIIGRWGNFFNQEAHGGIVSRLFLEKLHLPEFIIKGMNINGNYYHPTFLYESLLNLIVLIIILLIRKYNKKYKDGTLVSIYLISYGIIRFFIESLRTDPLMIGPIKIAQIVSIILFILGIVLIIKFNIKKGEKNEKRCSNNRSWNSRTNRSSIFKKSK